jgi:26S proteasome regulatory subunit N1
MGLGISYARTHKEDVSELVLPLVSDGSQTMETIGLAALSLGMVFVGSCSDAISGAILEVGPGTSAPVSGAAAHLFGGGRC